MGSCLALTFHLEFLLPSFTQTTSEVVLYRGVPLLLDCVGTVAVLGRFVFRAQRFPEVIVHILTRRVCVGSSVGYVVLDGIWLDDVAREGRVLGLNTFGVLVTETFESVAEACSIGVPTDCTLAHSVFAVLL